MVVILSAHMWTETDQVAYAAGELVVSFDTQSGKPMFDMQHMVPGEYASRNVTVYNGSTIPQTVRVRGVMTSVTGAFDDALAISIRAERTVVYTEQPLSRFIKDSASIDGVVLSSVPTGQKVKYTVTVRMYESAGNQFQSKRLSLDILFGTSEDVLPQCARIQLDGQLIYGSDGSERLKGTNRNDLIVAKGGNDSIDGKGGDDCIVATSGNKIVYGGKGNDIIVLGNARGIVFGDEGGDVLIGTRQSILNGGLGLDVCRGGLRISCERDTL